MDGAPWQDELARWAFLVYNLFYGPVSNTIEMLWPDYILEYSDYIYFIRSKKPSTFLKSFLLNSIKNRVECTGGENESLSLRGTQGCHEENIWKIKLQLVIYGFQNLRSLFHSCISSLGLMCTLKTYSANYTCSLCNEESMHRSP